MPSKSSRRVKGTRRAARQQARDELRGSLRVAFMSSVQSPLAFPDRFITKLVYAAGGQVAAGVAFSDKIWNINSVFDPDQSGVGHQPRYFDQMALIYNRYRVISATFDLSVRQRATHGISVLLVPNNSTSGFSSSTIPAELRRSGVVRITSSNQPPVVFRTKFEPWAVTGVTREQYLADDRFQALTSANPSEAICAHQYVESMDGSTTVDYEYMMQIVYEVEFFDALDTGTSLLAREHARLANVPAAEAATAAPAPPSASGSHPMLVWSDRENRYLPVDE